METKKKVGQSIVVELKIQIWSESDMMIFLLTELVWFMGISSLSCKVRFNQWDFILKNVNIMPKAHVPYMVGVLYGHVRASDVLYMTMLRPSGPIVDTAGIQVYPTIQWMMLFFFFFLLFFIIVAAESMASYILYKSTLKFLFYE